jgi:hypothetical protein
MADLMRIEIIYRHGGIYVDVDVEPLRSFEPLLQHDFFVVGCELFGGRALHPAARALLDRLQQYDTLPSDVPINVTTGPVLWRTTLFEPELFPGVVRPPFELFAPWTYEEKADRRRITSETFAVNHWFASWVPKPPLHQRALERGHRLGSRAKRLLRRR